MSDVHPNLKRLSHSTCVEVHTCPRKFLLNKLLEAEASEDTLDFAFGKAVGDGIQELLSSRSIERAYIAAFKAWSLDITDGVDIKYNNKTLSFAFLAIDRFVELLHTRFANLKTFMWKDKPAKELGFTIDLGDGFNYRGYLDTLAIDTALNELVTLEIKTTKFNKISDAMFANSSQIGYSLVVDSIAATLNQTHNSSWKVIYLVWKASEMKWEILEFTKVLTQRANLLREIIIDKQMIINYWNMEYFPQHGESCYNYFRECTHFGVCGMHMDTILKFAHVKDAEPDDKYEFKFTLAQIIEDQLKLGES